MYPNITVELTTDTNYADDALMHLQSGDYETVMMIPAVDKADLSNYFISYGDLDTMKTQINYATTWEYGGQVYGVPSTATTQGIVYNKKVFEEAGVTELPKTPEEFIDALQKIKDNTDAIPLYTNYAAGWTMGAWDAYIGNNATGDNTYMNQKFVHTKDPFQNYGDDTHAYAVYKILYDAVADGLIEDDFATTDWEGCKGMINNGEIGCMVLGSWAYPQMEAAGENGADIGYMPFPITVNGEQYKMKVGSDTKSYSSSDDGYFKLNAGNFNVEKSIENDANSMATHTVETGGISKYDIIAELKDLSTNTDKMTFRGCKAEDFLICLMGDAALNAESANSFQSIYSNIEQTIASNRISISGVDADEEAASMINYQNAYNLSSKMISVLCEVYDKLIQETGV